MSCDSTFPSKTLCRIFAFFDLFIGLLSIYYCNINASFTDTITYASRWDSVSQINQIDVRETISRECGKDYLSTVTPKNFGSFLWTAWQVFVGASALFCVKGFALFFVTCFSPILAKRCSLAILLLDVVTIGLLVYGLLLFRDHKLCLLSCTDIYDQRQTQSQVVFATLGILTIFTPVELVSILCLICDQSKLISAGELRSKGARRSEAFRTPVASRVNSFMQGQNGINGGYFRIGRKITKRLKPIAVDLQTIHSDDELEDQEEDQDSVKFYPENEHFDTKGFVEIDLNDNENNNGTDDGDPSPLIVLHAPHETANTISSNRGKNDEQFKNCKDQRPGPNDNDDSTSNQKC